MNIDQEILIAERISCKLTRNCKNIPGETREVRELRTTICPPFQRIASVKVFTGQFEILLDFICECLREIAIASCEVDLLRRGF
jgi:hypothetical protein